MFSKNKDAIESVISLNCNSDATLTAVTKSSESVENNLVSIEQIDENDESMLNKLFSRCRSETIGFLKKNKIIFKWIFVSLILIAYPIYFGFAMKITRPFDIPSNANNVLKDHVFANNKGLALFVLTVVTALLLVWDKLVKRGWKLLRNKLKCPINTQIFSNKRFRSIFVWVCISVVSIGCIIYLAITIKDKTNLISLAGLVVLILITILLSKKPSKINYRTLVVGILMQFILGVFVMRTDFGYYLFKFLGDQVEIFLDYTDAGSSLVFGSSFRDHYFAFKAMAVIIYFSSIVSILYYIGAIQYFILKISWLVNLLMDTSPTESINATANIFIGMSEAPLLIKPFLPSMTNSELFAVMVGGFATVSGSVLAAYIGFNVPANHLIVASIMSAPAALAVAKVMYPESTQTNADWKAIKNFPKSEAANIFEVIANGATAMVKVVAAIVANLISFVAVFSFLDAIVAWFLSMLDVQDAGFSTILQYIFWPLSLVMGVDINDCLSVGKLIGLKTFINEFAAYRELGKVIAFRKAMFANGTQELYTKGTLSIPSDIPMIWNDKSIIIATYALCGFSNFGSIGIQIANLSLLCPSKSKVVTKHCFLAMIAGSIACFMTATIAGLLYEPK